MAERTIKYSSGKTGTVYTRIVTQNGDGTVLGSKWIRGEEDLGNAVYVTKSRARQLADLYKEFSRTNIMRDSARAFWSSNVDLPDKDILNETEGRIIYLGGPKGITVSI